MLKLPSVRNLVREALKTFRRFPLALLVSIIATCLAMYLIHRDYSEFKNSNIWKIIMCCSLGLNLFLASELFFESKNQNKLKRLLCQLCALSLIVGYYFMLHEVKDFGVQEIVRFALFTVGLHLLVSFSPFISNGHIRGFWQFNKTLFLRFLTSGLYSGVLFAGLALALRAIEELFKVHVNGKYYADLWWFLAGIFNTWFFLAGVPKQTQTLDEVTDYPKGLKIFTQFVLLPLVTIYLLILYAYGTKIAILMQLPRGWVSYLVIGFSVAGILSLLLIFPIQKDEENSWIRIFSRWFYRALYPLIILLGLAIFKRVSQYGITENRYFILVLAVWLAGVASYFLLSKTKNIKVIPISLCMIAFLSSFGPWGAFSISERSQISLLHKLLIEEKIIVNEKIKKAAPILKGDNAEKITSIVSYLCNVHGCKGIQPWFIQDLDSLFLAKDSTIRYVNKKEIVLGLMGVEDYEGYSRNGEKNFYIHAEQTQGTLKVKGFDYFTEYYGYRYSASDDNYKTPIAFDKDTLLLNLDNKNLHIFKYGKELKNIDFEALVKKIKTDNVSNYDTYNIPNTRLIIAIETDSLSIQFNFTEISGLTEEDGSTKINNVNAKILIKRK